MSAPDKKIWDLYGDERAKSWVRHDDIDGYEWEVLGTGDYIPDVPNLPAIARFLAEHPETVDALALCHSWLNGIDEVWPDDLCEAATRLLDLTNAMRGEGGHE